MKRTSHTQRILSMLLAVVMLFGLMPTAAFAAQPGPDALLTPAAQIPPVPQFDFGPAGSSGACQLIPGIYNLPVAMKKADKPAEDSMAGGCIKGGKLEILPDGTAFVNLKLGSHTMMGLTAWASDWQIFNEHNVTSATTAAEIVAKEGNNVSEIRFALPYTNQDGVFAQMHVKAGPINMDPKAFLKMQYHQATHDNVAEAARVTAQIAAVGQGSLENELDVIAARTSYEWLVPESRQLVENEAALLAAEANIAALKQAAGDKALAAAVDEKIAALGEITLEKEAEVQAARAAYENLTDQQKTLVLNLALLDAAEARLIELKQQAQTEADQARAAQVDALIADIGPVALDNGSAEKIAAAQAAYKALTPAQQKLVTRKAALDEAARQLDALYSVPQLPAGKYQVPVRSLTSGAPLPQVVAAFQTAFGSQIEVEVLPNQKLMATIHPQHMQVEMDGTYHCNILKVQGAHYPAMKTERYSTTMGNPALTAEIQCPAEIVVELPAYDKAQGGYPLSLTADFMNALHGDVNADHFMQVLLNLDFTKAQPAQPAGFAFGSAGTVLEPGVYDLPVSLMNAANPEKPSMAASCVKGGSLEVTPEGEAFVTVKLGAVQVGNITGWGSSWQVYSGKPGSALTAAQVLSRNAAGEVTSIRFALPDRTTDGTFVQMTVAVMGMTPDGLLAMDFAAATPAQGYGPHKNVLAPGSYQLPMAMMQSAHPEKPSMAAPCLKDGYGVLTIPAEGQPTVTMQLGPVQRDGLEGWSSQWAVYQSYAAAGETAPAQVVSTDAAGHETAVCITLPFIDRDGVYVSLYVDAMQSRPDAFLRMDFDAAVELDAWAADGVQTAIAAIGEVALNSGSEEKIAAARTAYDALTPAQQKRVGNYAALLAAEAKLAELKSTYTLAAGVYTVPITSLTSKAPLPQVTAAFAKAFGDSFTLTVAENGTRTAAFTPRHMTVDLGNGKMYHCNVQKVKGASYPAMQSQIYTDPDGTDLPIQCPAEIVVELPAYHADAANARNGYLLELTVDFMNALLGGGVEQDHFMEVVLNVDLTRAQPVQPAQGTIARKGNSLSLDGEIHINHYVTITGFEGVDIEKQGGLLIWKTPVTDETATFETAETVKPGLTKSEYGYGQQTDGIAAKEYADTLYFRVYVKDNAGVCHYGPLSKYGVRSYAENMIRKNKPVKQLCIEMLHYGAAAQLYFDYNTGDLANKNIAAQYPAAQWDPNALTPLASAATDIVPTGDVNLHGHSLSLAGAIAMNHYYRKPAFAVQEAELLVWNRVPGTLTEATAARVPMIFDGKDYAAVSVEVPSRYYGETVFVCARFVDTDGNVHYSAVSGYSPEKYAASKIKQNKNPLLVETMKKMVMYGEEAQRYFAL